MTLKDSPSSPANHHKSAKHAPRANPHFVPAQQSMRPQPFVHSKQQHEQTEKACGRVGGSQNMPKNRCCFFLLHLSAYGQLVVWVSILLCCYSTAPGYTTSKAPPSNVQEQYSTIVARTLQHAIIPPVTGNSGHKQSQKTVSQCVFNHFQPLQFSNRS